MLKFGDIVEVNKGELILPGRIVKDEEDNLVLQFVEVAAHNFPLEEYLEKNGKDSVYGTGYFVGDREVKKKTKKHKEADEKE